MLSRIAESMFWIGRYVERGDNTARMVQTQLRLIAEDTSRGESDSCRNLLALMSIDDEDNPEPTAADLLRRTVLPGSVTGALVALATIAADVGETIERTALILVGRALAAEDFDDSRLYAPDYDRRFRAGRTDAVKA